jgi:hypothetical protein
MNNFGFTERPRKRIFAVLCGNYQEFNDFCKNKIWEYESRFNHFEGCEFVYYSSGDSIRGLRFDGIIKHGTYYKRKDIDFTLLNASLIRRNLENGK